MNRATTFAALAVAVVGTGAATATAVVAPPLPDKVECRFVKGLPRVIPISPTTRLYPTSTECKTTVYEQLGDPYVNGSTGQQCQDYVARPTLRWYHGNQLHDGVLRDAQQPYAVLRDDSYPISVCS